MTTFFEGPDGPDWFIMFLSVSAGFFYLLLMFSLL